MPNKNHFKNATFSGCGLRIWLSSSMGKTIHIQTYRVRNFQHASNSNIDHYLISVIRTKCCALMIAQLYTCHTLRKRKIAQKKSWISTIQTTI